jgi:hypothetical protein
MKGEANTLATVLALSLVASCGRADFTGGPPDAEEGDSSAKIGEAGNEGGGDVTERDAAGDVVKGSPASEKTGGDSGEDGAISDACQNGTTGAVAPSCTSTPKPSAYLTTFVQDPDTVAGACNTASVTAVYDVVGASADILTTGLPNSPVANGSDPSGVTVPASVACSVVQTGDGFDVSATISTGMASTFTLLGTSPWTSTAGPTNVNISFGGNDVSYFGQGCTVTYSAFTSEPIAPGRVWGTFNCPDMMEAGDSSGQSYVCMGTGAFQLTNCTE